MSEPDRAALLAEFPVRITESVRWGDMDAFNHVNNIVYLQYFESARIAYFRTIDFIGNGGTMKVGPILASTDCKFKMPLAYPDRVDIGARVTDIGSDRFTMAYRVVSHRHTRIAADGHGEIVIYNYADRHRTDLPPTVRRRIEILEKGHGA